MTQSQRSSTVPSTTDHQRTLETMFQSTVSQMKLNSELDHKVMELQGELVKLNQELKDEEREAIQVSELNSDVYAALPNLRHIRIVLMPTLAAG